MADTYEKRIIRREFATHNRCGYPPAFGRLDTDTEEGVFRWYKAGFVGLQTDKGQDPARRFVSGINISDSRHVNAYCDAEVLIVPLTRAYIPLSSTEIIHDAMINNIADHRAVGVVVSREATDMNLPASPNSVWAKKRSFLPCAMPEDEAIWVMDWFLPTAMWPQKTDAISKSPMIWMVKLQKCNLEQQSWWAKAEHLPPPLSERCFEDQLQLTACSECGEESVEIFEGGFVCLNHECDKWWHTPDTSEEPPVMTALPTNREFVYSKIFLQDRLISEWSPPISYSDINDATDESPPLFEHWPDLSQSLTQLLPNVFQNSNDVINYTLHLLRSFVCPHCTMINRRLHWNRWQCSNPKCKPYIWNLPPPLFHINDAIRLSMGPGPNIVLPQPDPFVDVETIQLAGGRFTISIHAIGKESFAALIEPSPGVNAMELNGSDHFYHTILLSLASQTIDAQRHLTQVGNKESWTSFFSSGFGPANNQTRWEDTAVLPELLRVRDAANLLLPDFVSRFQPGPYAPDYGGYFNSLELVSGSKVRRTDALLTYHCRYHTW